MKRIKYLLFILLFPTIVLANDEYKITSCDTEILINAENNYVYEEALNFAFYNENVLVTKTLLEPTKDIIIDKDYLIETTDTKLIKIFSNGNKNLSYNIKYTVKNSSNSKSKYKINLCNNYNNEVDEINFHINLPSSFTSDNIKFYLNDQEYTDITYQIKDNTLSGKYTKLNENDTLSINVDYGNLYYSDYAMICIILPITFAIFSGILWYLYGKDIKYKISRISKLPNSINLMNIALVNDGVVTYEEAYYLMLDLANRGYLTIKENKNHQFTIIRGKEYDGKDYIEASFLKALFRKTIKVTISEYVNALSKGKRKYIKELVSEIPDSNIKENFDRACNYMLSLINTNEEKNKYFEQDSDAKRIYLIAMIAVILVLVTSFPFIKINKLYLLPISVIISVVTLYLLLNLVDTIDLNKKTNKIQLLIIPAILTIIIMLIPSFNYNRLYIISFLISMVSVALILFFYKYMPKRTIYGTKIFAKIESFRVYIDELRDEDLKNLLVQEPNYLMDILASSLIIDRGDLILKKIKDLNIEEPSWYRLEDGYTPTKFGNSINRLKNRLKTIDEEK